MTYRFILIISVFTWGCSEKKPTGQEYASEVLSQLGIYQDTTDNNILTHVMAEVNCLSAEVGGKRVVLEDKFIYGDTNLILLIPYSTMLKDLSSPAFSEISNHYIIINPTFIRKFAKESLLNDTTGLPALFKLILLHELGHFKLGFNGAYDAPEIKRNNLNLGEQKMDTEPEYLTTVKRREMSVDSMAILMVKKGLSSKDMNCLSPALDVEIMLPGMSFQLFGIRLLDQFGQPNKILRDPSPSHPNMELRVAFMNYFLMPNDQLKEMIDDYLYNREVAPVHQQEIDPRIYQGTEKILPGDK